MKATDKQWAGIHVIDTEVRDFDRALAIIAKRQKHEKAAATKRAKGIKVGGWHQSIKQEAAVAYNHTLLKMGRHPLTGSRRAKLPHPLKDLPPEVKAVRVREMYDHGYGYWGIGVVAFRRLARAFGVPYEQVEAWCS